MMSSQKIILTIVCACAVLALTGCASKPPKPVQTRTWLNATADANPDLKGRPSPVVVRVFQLKTDAEFNSADFFALYEREKETLGPAYIVREEYVLQPGEQRELLVPLARDTRYVGAIAAFRDIRGSRWRALSVAPRRTTGDMFSKDRMTLTVERTSIKLTVKD
jgi:type VI secretion system protein VasD